MDIMHVSQIKLSCRVWVGSILEDRVSQYLSRAREWFHTNSTSRALPATTPWPDWYTNSPTHLSNHPCSLEVLLLSASILDIYYMYIQSYFGDTALNVPTCLAQTTRGQSKQNGCRRWKSTKTLTIALVLKYGTWKWCWLVLNCTSSCESLQIISGIMISQ